MGNLVVALYKPSYDGKYYGRYPNGDKPAGASFAGAPSDASSASGALGTPGPITNVTTLQLTSASGGSNLPWTFGQVFSEGDVPNGYYLTTTSGATQFQADVRNRWPDGSAKYAALSGFSALSAGVAGTVQIAKTTAPAAAANVPEPTNLANTNVVLTPGAGSYPIASGGTYAINAVLGVDRSIWSLGGGGRVRQILGPVMSEFHYYQPTSDIHLAIWWYVRAYSDAAGGIGAVEIETVLENGWWQEANPSEKDYSVAVNINGVTTLSQSNIQHLSHTRWGRVDWYSGGAPIVPAHNTAYLAASKVVPNFGWRAPAASTLTSFLETAINPPPFVQDIASGSAAYGDLGTSLGSAGSSPWIGVLTQWEALYCTTADNSGSYTASQRHAPYTATIGNTRQAGAFGQHYRDETTGRVPLWSSYAGYGVSSGWGTNPPAAAGGVPPVWEIPHLPACGYLAYLIEGRWSQLEELQWSAWQAIQDSDPLGQWGTLQALHAPQTTRGWAWSMRAVGQAAAVSPTSLGGNSPQAADAAVGASFVTSISNTCSFNRQVYIDGTATLQGGASAVNAIGWIGQYDQYSGAPIPASEWWGGSWMVGFQGHALGHIADLGIEGLTNLADLIALRNFVWLDTLQKWQGATTEYAPSWNFRRGALYEAPYLAGSSSPASPAFIATHQAALALADYQTTWGLSSTLTANPGDSLKRPDSDADEAPGDSSEMGGEGYWAIHGSIGAMAVENAIPVAAARYALITGASNWNPQGSSASDEPQMSFAPRTLTAPSWYTSIAPGTWGTLPNSVLTGTAAQTYGCNGLPWSNSDGNIVTPWSGGILNTVGIYDSSAGNGDRFIPGTFLCIWGGGHGDYDGNQMYCYGPLESASPQWLCPRPATNPPPQNEDFDASDNPVSRHTYATLVHLPNQNWMMSVCNAGRYLDGGGVATGSTATFRFNVPNPASNQPWTSLATAPQASQGGVAVYDPLQNSVFAQINTQLLKYDPIANAWSQNTQGLFNYNAGNIAGALDSKRGLFALWNGAGGGAPTFQVLLYQTSQGISGTPWQPATTGTAPPSGGRAGSIAYDVIRDRFVIWANSGATLWTLTPPSSSPYSGGNAWTWGTLSPSSGATPSAEQGAQSGDGTSLDITGTFGRFQSVPNPLIAGYILMNRPGDPIYFYRP